MTPHSTIAIRDFHRTWGVATPLHQLPGRIYIKDESHRFGLNAYKILGASWALHRLALPPGSTIATATAGNHGRAVAHAARKLGLVCIVYLPAQANPVRVARIVKEGAQVVRVNGSYDDAVRACVCDSDRNGWQVVQDLLQGDYRQIPEWIIDGYSTLFAEATEQLPESPERVVLHMGGGNFAAAGVRHFAGKAQIVVGHPVPDSRTLDCLTVDEPSMGILDSEVDRFVAITDDDAQQAVEYLAAHGIAAGPSGAGGVAALLKLGISGPALAVVTEGPVVD